MQFIVKAALFAGAVSAINPSAYIVESSSAVEDYPTPSAQYEESTPSTSVNIGYPEYTEAVSPSGHYAVETITASITHDSPEPVGTVSASIIYTEAPKYTTTTVSSFVTICPSPTTFEFSGKTYTVTESTILTITDCPCTVVRPVIHGTVIASSVVPEYTAAVPTSEHVPSHTPAPVYPTGGNGTVPHPTGSHSAPPSEFTGAAAQFGVGMLAVVAAGAAML